MATSILLVDDEPHVLQALQRLLRRDGYTIHAAKDGKEALAVLAQTPISVLICDQRMPGMSGSEVLAAVYQRSPDTVRITLTGYTDLAAAQASVNQGHVQYFLLKPWNDEQLRAVVREAAAAYELVMENRRLATVVQSQKSELEELNRGLEHQVQERTKELEERNRELLVLSDRLHQSLRGTVGVLVGLLEASSPALAIHSKRVAELARRLADRMGLPSRDAEEVELASHLHEIGRLSLLRGNPADNSESTRELSDDFAVIGHAVLARITGFERIASAVRHQHEFFDGSGQPDRLAGTAIPLAARIIAVTNTYDEIAFRDRKPSPMSCDTARRMLITKSGRQFDPELTAAFCAMVEQANPGTAGEIEVSSQQVTEGMVLARDLLNIHGVLLLKQGTVLTRSSIDRIDTWSIRFQLRDGIFVRWAGGSEPSNIEAASPEVPAKVDPKEAPPPTSEVSPPASARTQERRRILVVDDSEEICAALVRELRREEFDVVVANSVHRALELLGESPFDIVLTDLFMPDIGGDQLLRCLAAKAPSLPCVVMSGNPNAKTKVRELAKSANLAGILVKPWTHERLIEVIEAAWKRRKVSRTDATSNEVALAAGR